MKRLNTFKSSKRRFPSGFQSRKLVPERLQTSIDRIEVQDSDSKGLHQLHLGS